MASIKKYSAHRWNDPSKLPTALPLQWRRSKTSHPHASRSIGTLLECSKQVTDGLNRKNTNHRDRAAIGKETAGPEFVNPRVPMHFCNGVDEKRNRHTVGTLQASYRRPYLCNGADQKMSSTTRIVIGGRLHLGIHSQAALGLPCRHRHHLSPVAPAAYPAQSQHHYPLQQCGQNRQASACDAQ